MILFLSSLFLLIFILFIPENAFAWGPGMHIEMASSVLKNLQILPEAIQILLHSFRYDFIYGCISADIINGKKYTEYAKHCHNWHIGMKVLDSAKNDSQKAFAYGYLCHLAADVVAHNYYVPNQIISSFSTRLLKHTYWELRFDGHVDKSVWKMAEKVAKEMHRDNDPLLMETLDDTLFSFRTNKKIFNSLLMMARMKRWHHAMDLISAKSKWLLTEEDVKTYKKITLDSVFAFLVDGKKARCCRADPAGRKSLQMAHEIRKELKTLKWLGRISEKDYPEIFDKLKPSFKKATFDEFGSLNLKEIIG